MLHLVQYLVLSGPKDWNLKHYELKDHEWTIVEQLQDCLKVCIYFF